MTRPIQRVNYDSVAARYDRRYDLNWYDGIIDALQRFVGARPGQSVAEVGCGTGHWLAGLAGLAGEAERRVAGLDSSRSMLERARAAAPAALLVQGTAERLPWADAAFDRVFCVNALHHFFDQQAFIAECHRVLRPDDDDYESGLRRLLEERPILRSYLRVYATTAWV